MTAIDLWTLGVFQGDTGVDALSLLYALGVPMFMRLGRLYERAGGIITPLEGYSGPPRPLTS